MKALLLNSGIGKRMGELTKDKPKCLVEVNVNETILYRQIKSLINNGIKDVVLTTGPFEDKIKKYMKENFPDVNVEYVFNDLYDSTNYIYSLLLTKGLINDDVILMHGDLVYEEKLFKRIIESENENLVLINKEAVLPKKDFKGRVEKGRVLEISINIFDKNCFFLIPLYKLSKDLWEKWFAEMEKFMAKGKLNIYAEEALNNILNENNLSPFYFCKEFCSEIDNLNDLENAKRFLKYF